MPVTLRFSHGGSLKVVQKPRPQESVDYWDALCRKVPPQRLENPETPTDPILVSIESLVECGPVRTREQKTEHDEERDWVIHST